MPVTKKQGAIFAIYSDSPGHPTNVSPTHRVAGPSRAEVSMGSPKSKGLAKRLVLGDKVPKAQQPVKRGLKASDGKDSKDQVEKPKALSGSKESSSKKSALSASQPIVKNPSKPTIKFASPSTTTAKASKTASKRAFEIFTDPRPSPSRGPTPSQSIISPTKKTRTSPHRPPPEDKENAPPHPFDSPASRTRSKTRSGGMGKGKDGPTVRADAVLGDVSGVYGAVGDAPLGFREQGTMVKGVSRII